MRVMGQLSDWIHHYNVIWVSWCLTQITGYLTVFCFNSFKANVKAYTKAMHLWSFKTGIQETHSLPWTACVHMALFTLCWGLVSLCAFLNWVRQLFQCVSARQLIKEELLLFPKWPVTSARIGQSQNIGKSGSHVCISNAVKVFSIYRWIMVVHHKGPAMRQAFPCHGELNSGVDWYKEEKNQTSKFG